MEPTASSTGRMLRWILGALGAAGTAEGADEVVVA